MTNLDTIGREPKFKIGDLVFHNDPDLEEDSDLRTEGQISKMEWDVHKGTCTWVYTVQYGPIPGSSGFAEGVPEHELEKL